MSMRRGTTPVGHHSPSSDLAMVSRPKDRSDAHSEYSVFGRSGLRRERTRGHSLKPVNLRAPWLRSGTSWRCASSIRSSGT
eukprot:50030-Eustigmatos_ZCMA.PRE.1